ncbi:MAG: S-layer homology domain-containing protein [Eubacteriales bacterium]
MLKMRNTLLIVLLLFLAGNINAYALTNLNLPITPIKIIIPAAPAAPSGLTSESYASGFVDLNWIDNSSSELSFLIQKSVNGGAYSDFFAPQANITTYTDVWTKNGEIYTYKVKAVNAYGDSAYSNESTVTVPLHFPFNFKATLDGDNVKLTWEDYSYTETNFVIERVESGGPFQPLITLAANTTSYIDTDITKGIGYTYRMYAINYQMASEFTLDSSVVIPAESAPSAPTNLKFEGWELDAIGDSQAKFSWTDNSINEDYFALERKEAGGTFKGIIGIGTNGTDVIDSEILTVGKTYVYRINAVNEKLGNSAYSNEVSVVIPSKTSPVAAPSVLAATASSGIAALTWKDNSSNEEGFTVERKASGGSFKYLNGTSSGMTALIDNSLVAGTSYVYRVKAINSTLGDSAYSNEATILVGLIVPAAVDFSSASSWAITEIQKAIDYKLTTDKVLKDFTKKITREEFSEIAVKLYEAISGKAAVSDANPFIDTANIEILKAYKLGIVKGMTLNTFAPDNSITRQEISVMLLRALKAARPGADYSILGAPVIADEKEIASWALDAVKYMNKEGIMNGTGGNIINPKGNTTKEQAIALLKRLYEKSK